MTKADIVEKVYEKVGLSRSSILLKQAINKE